MKTTIKGRIEDCPGHSRLDFFLEGHDKFIGISYTSDLAKELDLKPGDKLKVILIK